MPAKIICMLTVIVLQLVVVWAMPTKSFAQPPWCPDLTHDNFVNFEDFSLQANNWLLEGSFLEGDFDRNSIVNIFDFDYLSVWWLRDCSNPPPGPCPDCNYPDCNLMDCNVPTDNPCYYCESTPSFIKVTINGNHGCGCSCQHYYQGSSYVDPNASFDGNYIVPYIGYCQWEGIYNISTIKIEGFYPGYCCDPQNKTDPNDIANRYTKIKILVWKGDSIETLGISLWNEYWEEWGDYPGILIDNVTNCIKGSGNYGVCYYGDDPPNPGDFGNGSANISLPWEGENLNKDSSILTLMPDKKSKQNSFEGQKGMMQLQAVAISWLKE